MRKLFISLCCLVGLTAIVALNACAVDVDFTPSTYNPAVGQAVAFEVCEPCLGGGAFSYEWDFDGDGIYEVTTEDSLFEHSFHEPGYRRVAVRVVDAGRLSATRTKGILVGETAVFATRSMLREKDGSTFVLVKVTARDAASAPALEEQVPRGWQVDVLESQGTFMKMADGILQVLWADTLFEGDTRTFSYRLFPSYAAGNSELVGTNSAYHSGARVKNRVCGDTMLSP